jgi:hypothetical protein
MSHIALRHATHNVSKAYMAQAGLGILGGVLGGRTGANTGQIINAVGGFGLNTLFLEVQPRRGDAGRRHGRADDGARRLRSARDGELLRPAARPGAPRSRCARAVLERPPGSSDRAARIRREAEALDVSGRRTASVGGFEEIQSRLRGRGAAPSMGRLARGDDRGEDRRGGYGTYGGRHADVTIERPSTRFRTFAPRDGLFTVEYPDNWRVYESDRGVGVTLAPEGGVTEDRGGQQGIVYGVIINRYDPFESRDGYSDDRDRYGSSDLEQATDDLVEQLLRTNSYLRRSSGSPRREVLDGSRALSLTLSGRSPLTDQDERVTVFTRELPEGGLVYSLLIAPSREYGALDDTFQRMVESLRVNDRYDVSQARR